MTILNPMLPPSHTRWSNFLVVKLIKHVLFLVRILELVKCHVFGICISSLKFECLCSSILCFIWPNLEATWAIWSKTTPEPCLLDIFIFWNHVNIRTLEYSMTIGTHESSLNLKLFGTVWLFEGFSIIFHLIFFSSNLKFCFMVSAIVLWVYLHGLTTILNLGNE